MMKMFLVKEACRGIKLEEIVRLVENNRFLKLIVLLLAANNFEPIEGETKLKLLVLLLDKMLGGLVDGKVSGSNK